MPSKTFNISDVSQKTGVASVTLRAWERRYGLVKPQRTPKGHRVYTEANIEEIRQIVSWLNRGVAISKVAPLLAEKDTKQQLVSNDDHWQQTIDELYLVITQLKQVTLNQLCDKLNKSTPFHTLCQQVYQPLNEGLMLRWNDGALGYELEQQLWQQAWQRQITLMSLRADKQKAHASCWLVNIGFESVPIDYWMLYGLLLQYGVRVHAINANASIAGLARLDHDTDRSLILFADKRLDANSLIRLNEMRERWQARLLCVGAAVDIHKLELDKHPLPLLSGSISIAWTQNVMQDWLRQVEIS